MQSSPSIDRGKLIIIVGINHEPMGINHEPTPSTYYYLLSLYHLMACLDLPWDGVHVRVNSPICNCSLSFITYHLVFVVVVSGFVHLCFLIVSFLNFIINYYNRPLLMVVSVHLIRSIETFDSVV